MKNYFNIDDISHLKQYVPVYITDEMVENHFEYVANSYKDELDKLAYVELIKKTIENMTHLPVKVNENIYKSIYHENDLDKLAKYYLLSKDLVDNYKATELWEDFLYKEDICRRFELLDEIDNEWEEYEIDYDYRDELAYGMDKNIEWVRINRYKKPLAIEDINKEFEDWISRQDLEDYISSYDKVDFKNELRRLTKKNYFNFDDIAYLRRYEFAEITNKALENNFESMANSYKAELDKLAYAELIKKTVKNMTHLPDKVNDNIFRSIYHENDLDKLAGYYKLSEELAYEDYETTELWDNFKAHKKIYPIADLWDRMDNELKKYGTNANLYLVSDLLQMDKNIEWVRINIFGRAEAIGDIKDLYAYFEDIISRIDLEKYLRPYNKEEFIEDFKLKEKLEEKLANKEEKALVM